MVGGALLTNALVFAVGFDVGYQSGAKRGKAADNRTRKPDN
jgi:hypothetical protein